MIFQIVLQLLPISGLLFGLSLAMIPGRSANRLIRALWIMIIWQGIYFFIYQTFFIVGAKAGPLGKYLALPTGPYYLSQVTADISTLLAAWMSALLVFFLGWFIFVVRGKSERIDTVDILLLTLGAAAVGWPSIFIFLAIVFFLSVFGLLLHVIRRRKTWQDRLVITSYIIPAAVITLIFRIPLLTWTQLIKIRF